MSNIYLLCSRPSTYAADDNIAAASVAANVAFFKCNMTLTIPNIVSIFCGNIIQINIYNHPENNGLIRVSAFCTHKLIYVLINP